MLINPFFKQLKQNNKNLYLHEIAEYILTESFLSMCCLISRVKII